MKYLRRPMSLVLFLAPLVLVVLLGIFTVQRFLRFSPEFLGRLASHELTRALKSEVRIDRVVLTRGHLEAQGIAIADGHTFAQNGTLASADQASLNFDLRRILFDDRPDQPMIDTVKVKRPHIRLARNKKGELNISKLFQQPQKPGGRLVVGKIEVVEGTLDYSDESPGFGGKQLAPPIDTRLTNVESSVYLEPNGGARWTGKATGDVTTLAAVGVVGEYDSEHGSLKIQADVERLKLAELNGRALGDWLTVNDGLGTGTVALSVSNLKTSDSIFDYNVDAQISNASLQPKSFRKPVTQVSGALRVWPNHVIVDATGVLEGAPIAAKGRITDFDKPIVVAEATTTHASWQSILKALPDIDIPAEIRGVDVVGDLHGSISGALSNPDIEVEGPLHLAGKLPKGLAWPSGATVEARIAGSVTDPVVWLTGTVPVLKVKDITATQLQVRASVSKQFSIAEFSSKVGGGNLAGRAELTIPPKGKRRYRVVARGRGIKLGQLGLKDAKNLAGTGRFDVAAAGALEDDAPASAWTRILLNDVEWESYKARSVRLRAHLDGNLVTVDRFGISDDAGRAQLAGTAKLKEKTLDLVGWADDLHVADLAQMAGVDGASDLRGVAYLRDLRVMGSWKDPVIGAEALGYGIGTDKLALDFVRAKLAGGRAELAVTDGEAWRLPGKIKLSGVIRRLSSADAELDLSGVLDGLDLTDVALLAGAGFDVYGVASGSIDISGPLKRPMVTVAPVVVSGAGVGDYEFDAAEAALRWEGGAGGGRLFLDRFTASRGEALLDAEGHIASGGNFELNASAYNVSLDQLDPYVSDYVDLKGFGSVQLSIAGRLVDGKGENVAGELTASIPDLSVNGATNGSLYARLSMQGDRIFAEAIDPGQPGVQAMLDQATISLTRAEFDRTTRDVTVDGKVAGVTFGSLARSLRTSPLSTSRQQGPAQRWLLPILDAIDGSMSASISVRGKSDSPEAQVVWNGEQVAIGGKKVDRLAGDVTFNRNEVNLKSARLEAGDTTLSASGMWEWKGAIEAEAELTQFDLQTLATWFPGIPELARFQGTADSVWLRAEGPIDSPRLDGSVILDRLVVLPEAGAPSTQAALQIDRLSIPRVTIDKGRLTLVDLGLRFKEVYVQPPVFGPVNTGTTSVASARYDPVPVPPQSAASASDPPHEIHASGEVQWSWTSPQIHPDAAIELRLSLPQQKLSLIRALVPGTAIVAEGDIEGRVNFKGTYAQLTNPATGFAQGVEPPIISGGISVVASRLRFGSMTTALGDIDLNLKFEGDALKAESKTKPRTPAQLFVDVVDPSNNRTLTRSEPVAIQGELPIQPGVRAATPLTITSNKIRFLESPLPFFQSGRAVGEIAGRTPAEPGLNITITDHLLAPHIAGDIRIQKADLRLPDALTQELGSTAVTGIQPTFDLRLAVGENVRATASTLTARVSTAPAAPITLKGSLDQPVLDGSLQVLDGSLSFPTTRFTLQRGGTVALKYPAFATMRLNDPAFGVFVDVAATTRLVAQSITGETKRYTVTVRAKGPLNSSEPAELGAVAANPVPADRKLQLEFNSDPADLALSQAGLEKKITSLLGGQDAIQNLFQGGQGAARALEGQLASMLSQRLLPGLLDSAGVASWLGFDELSLGYDTYDQLSLRASRRLFGSLTISYWRRLTNITSTGGALRGMWELKLSQPLRRNLLFSITTGDQRVNAFLLEGVYRF